jgi:outer membrane protein, multidrug efflux system
VAREQLNETRRQAEFEVAQAMRSIRVAQQSLTVAEKTRAISAETARLTRFNFENGNGTSFDLVDTARRLREAELDLAIKEFEVVRAKLTALLSLATCNI